MGGRDSMDWCPFVYGGLASIIAELGTFPLDTTKTRLQVQGQKFDKKYASLRYSGMTDALVTISKQEGFKSLYCGLTRPLSTGCIKYAGIVSNLPEPVQKSLDEHPRERRKTLITVGEEDDISVVSGVPEDHIKNRTVRIYQPPKNAMQSGTNNINFWQIDFDTRERWENPLIGWCSTGDPMSNLKVEFTSAEEAVEHCKKMKWRYYIQKPNVDAPKPRSYGANFAWDKRTRVSTK